MEGFLDLVKIIIICLTICVVVFLVLLALPQSKFRSFVLELFGWSGAGLATAGVISPIDVLPDVLPGLGQLDDIGYIVMAITCGLIAYHQHRARKITG